MSALNGATRHLNRLTIGFLLADEEKATLIDQVQQANAGLARANEQLRSLATTDALTGLLNRRGFDAALAREWALAERDRQQLSLLILDLDHFKRLNDTKGHQAGDTALRIVADGIAAAIRRPCDIAARYGGEELAVILPDTGFDGAVTVAEVLLAAVEALDITHEASQFGHITVSIGAATLVPAPDGQDGYRMLIERADKALYTAKSAGRNRVSAYASQGQEVHPE